MIRDENKTLWGGDGSNGRKALPISDAGGDAVGSIGFEAFALLIMGEGDGVKWPQSKRMFSPWSGVYMW